MTVKTSEISPIRIGSSSSDMRTIYTAIEVTETETTDGEPIYTSKVLRYSDSRRNIKQLLLQEQQKNLEFLLLQVVQPLKKKNI